jgi:ABC-type nitrate/sulfonate/bicarbonate transport system substrate-binding protein
MKRSILAAILALTLLLALTASCGKSEPAATTPATPSVSASPEATPSTPAQTTEPAEAPPEADTSAAPEPEYGPDGIAFADGKLTERFTLTLVKPTQFNDAIFAYEKGFYDEVGLDIEFLGALPQNVSLAQATQTGIVDVFGAGHTTNIALARQAGVNLKIVNAGTEDSPDFTQTHMTWFVLADSPIQSAADFKGKTIATTGLGGCPDLWTYVLLGQNGLSGADVEFTVLSNETLVEQALRQGDIDVGILHGPKNVSADAEGGLRVIATSYDIAKAAGNGALSAVGVRAFTEEFIAEHPAVVKAYVTASNRAQVWANANYDEALAITAEFLDVEPSMIAGCPYTKSLWVEEDRLKFWVDTAEKYAFPGFETPGAVNVKDLYTNDYNPFYLGELSA